MFNRLFLFLFIIHPFFSYSQVINGVFNIDKREIIHDYQHLDGKWEFYWHEFIKPNQIYEDKAYLQVPGTWTQNEKYPAWGYGSYRTIIRGLDTDKMYSLYIPDMSSNYKLFIDGILYSENGTLGTNTKESIPLYLPKAITFKPISSETEIIIHISNFDYRKSGIWRSLLLGTDVQIRTYQSNNVIIDTMAICVLLTVALFHLGIFLLRRKETSELLFGIICISLAFRALTTGEQLLTMFNPNISWELLRKMEYMPFYITIPIFVLFIKYIFPLDYSKLFNKAIYLISSILAIIILFLPAKFSNYTVPISQGVVVILIFYVLNIMIKVLKNRRESSILFTISYGIFFIASINDILYANFLIFTGFLAPLGFIFTIIGQSIMLTRKFIQSIDQKELLEISRDQFRKASITDALTGLYNSRYLYKIMDKEVIYHKETNEPLTFLMADVDNFKLFNDTYGHTNGDKVLRIIANTIKDSARDIDTACRYGGEEFSIILPNTNLEIGEEIAERIRENFEKLEYEDEKFNGITLSIGVSTLKDFDTVKTLIERADIALYKAKELGKNRVEIETEIILVNS